MGSRRLRMQVLAALFAGITAVFAQITIPLPFSPVPLTGQTLAVLLAATVLGPFYGMLSMVIYVLLGAVGVRVFAGFGGGFQTLIGPSGGYIFGFIIAAFVAGWLMQRRDNLGIVWAVFANAIGSIVIYAVGIVQLKLVTGMGWTEAALAGVVPFIGTDILKVVMASFIGVAVRRRLHNLGLLTVTGGKQEAA
ncbi:biotin transporter BioY [Numidum massiliense]|uniref:biotin transporter BioY n=1 Tax=Numidum massiliense TaxID=1522315 RepID=UPI0006D541E4|nr:biotin transporter BioY [Numidum massiliense]